MGLVTKTSLSLNQANTLITLTDITGVYNATTNPNGYGSPNRGNVNQIVDIVVTRPDNVKFTFRFNDALTDPFQIAKPVLMPANTLSKTIKPTDLGLLNDTDVLPIGVYKVDYYTWYRLADTGIVGNSSRNQINHLTGTFTSETTGFGTSAKWIKVIEQGHNYESDSRINTVVSDGVVTLDTPLPNQPWFAIDTIVSIYAGYLSTSYVLADAQLLSCFNPKIARLSIQPKSCCSQCRTTDTDILTDILLGISGIESQFKLGLYDNANKAIQTLYKVCKGEECKC